ncbi:hypothetical protein BD410DRAFT_883602 [Rickenella mellea]|uniref:Uncharacterized protein n=1 Tax=Rickenella mellea TaxID=50990 RepID=A0A4Y7PQU5_9AGAM|nr:hypothetical protein BD410DRAFT_883602 [Rickenella mellea]
MSGPEWPQLGQVFSMDGPLDTRAHEVFTGHSSDDGPSRKDRRSHQYVVAHVNHKTHVVEAFARSSFGERSIGARLSVLSRNYDKSENAFLAEESSYNDAQKDYKEWSQPPWCDKAIEARNTSKDQWRAECRMKETIRDKAFKAYETAKKKKDFAAKPLGMCRDLKDNCRPAGRLSDEDRKAGIYGDRDVILTANEPRNSYGYWNAGYVIVTNLKKLASRTKCPEQALADLTDPQRPGMILGDDMNVMPPEYLNRLLQIRDERGQLVLAISPEPCQGTPANETEIECRSAIVRNDHLWLSHVATNGAVAVRIAKDLRVDINSAQNWVGGKAVLTVRADPPLKEWANHPRGYH